MSSQIFDKLAEELSYFQHTSEIPKSKQKIYAPPSSVLNKASSKSGSGAIVLEPFAKLHGLEPNVLAKTVRKSSFFELTPVKIRTGFFIKKERQVNGVIFATQPKLSTRYNNAPKKVLTEAMNSRFLTYNLLEILNVSHNELIASRIRKVYKQTYHKPEITDISLYRKYLPDELEKYEQEGKTVSTLEKKFLKKVQKGSEFYFSDGKVANSLLSWVQCIQLAPPQVIANHLINHDFENWLRDEVKVRDLANIFAGLAKRFEIEKLNPWEIKIQFINRLNRTSLEGLIFEHTIKPVIKNLQSKDPSRAQEAAEKLMRIGDERTVEPLIGKLYDSATKTRKIVIKALGKFGDNRATPALLKILEYSTDKNDKINAIRAIGLINDKRAKKVLKKLARSHDEIGREAKVVLDSYY